MELKSRGVKITMSKNLMGITRRVCTKLLLSREFVALDLVPGNLLLVVRCILTDI